MTVKEIIEIFKENPYNWCNWGCEKALAKLRKLPPDMSIEEVAKLPDVITSEWAYWWVRNIGDKDIMIDKVTDSKWSYYWALEIGNKDVMINKITDSEWAYYWARYFGDKDIMIDRVTDSEWAYYWARDIGNRDIMKPRITDSKWIKMWNETFPEDKIEETYVMNEEKQVSSNVSFNTNLYLVTIRTSNPQYKQCYVVAANAQEAYDKYRKFLDQMDVLLESERELESVQLLAKDRHALSTIPLFIK